MFEKDMHIQCQGYTSIFTQTLAETWRGSEFADIAMIVDGAYGQKALIHKVILASPSPAFRRLLTQDGAGFIIGSASFHLKTIYLCGLQNLLNLIYHDEIIILKDKLDAFVSATDAPEVYLLYNLKDTDQRKISLRAMEV